MYLSYFILRKLVEDLRNSLVGKPIKRCALAPPHELYLDLDGASLLLSASPATGRVALCNFPREGLSDPPAWAERNLLKSTVESVELADLERIFSLVVTRRDRLGGQIRYRLICEVMGRHSNIILISEPQNRILGALRQVGGRMNRERQILPGKPYLPPPPLERIHPEKTTPSELFPFFKKEPDTLPNTLMHAVAGLDPISSAEVLHRASISTFADVSPETLERLCTELKSLFTAPSFLHEPQVLPATADRGMAANVLPLSHLPAGTAQSCTSVSEAIETLARSEHTRQALKGRATELERDLKNHLSSVEKKIARMEEDLADAEKADLYEKYGHILMANLHHIAPRSESVTLPDTFQPESSQVTIPLAPNRLPHENARDYLKRSQKARKGKPILERRLETASQERKTLQIYLDRANNLDSDTRLAALQEELVKAGLVKARQSRAAEASRTAGGIRPRRYRTSEGWLVLVGRNNTENDRLTKSAAKDDFFFHAHGCPGSHVILKREGKPGTPPRKTLEETAALAAYWSKARASKTVPVNYTEARYVGKPRGAAPGLVTIKNEKTVFVSPREITREDESSENN